MRNTHDHGRGWHGYAHRHPAGPPATTRLEALVELAAKRIDDDGVWIRDGGEHCLFVNELTGPGLSGEYGRPMTRADRRPGGMPKCDNREFLMPCLFDRTREQHAHSTLDCRTFLSDSLLDGRGKMDKRDRFIAELRHEAKLRGLSFRVETRRGKGGHAMIWLGDRVTTLPSRENRP
jgi:hypothetical protein